VRSFPRLAIVIIAALLVLLLAAAATLAIVAWHGMTIRISQEEIQDQATHRFPITLPCAYVFHVTLTDPAVTLGDGLARIHVSYGAGVLTSSYLHAALEHIDLEHGPNSMLERIRPSLSEALSAYLSSHPVYAIAPTNLTQTAARAVVRSLAIERQTLIVVLGW
jgi:hypothetical protein